MVSACSKYSGWDSFTAMVINRVKYLLLNPRSCIQGRERDRLIYFFIHSIGAAVAVSHGFPQDLVLFVKQDVIYSPCVNPHERRNLPQALYTS